MAGSPPDQRFKGRVQEGGLRLDEDGGEPIVGQRVQQDIVRALQLRAFSGVLRAHTGSC